MPGIRYERVRVYAGLRTAHLERFHALEPASVVYLGQNYDFDPDLLAGLDVHRVRRVRELWRLLLASPIRVMEVNEPLMLSASKVALVAVVCARLSGLRHRRRVRVVAYAIGNEDPFRGRQARVRTRARRTAFRLLTFLLVRSVDRLAVGTPGALAEYRPYLADGQAVRLVPALSAPCASCAASPAGLCAAERTGVTFVGAFDERKGLRELLAAWPRVAAELPGTPLRLLGKGPLADLALDVARRGEAEVTIDPSRREIHAALRASSVVVLLSQPSPTWREQVGLPILEGLSHGCTVVATTETGIADWLTEHGHRVLDPRTAGPDEIAAAVIGALRGPLGPDRVLADLPAVDGRLAADRWMFGSADPDLDPDRRPQPGGQRA